jgi:DnaJ domain
MPSARTHYQLLSVDPSAEPAMIKAAFRDQIARYHPDKVIHLGQEFQDLAAQRTAELTAAYKTLMNPALRVQYDATLAAVHAGGQDPRGPANVPRFAAERAGGDDIVQRALVARVRSVVSDLYGAVQSPRVRGFDVVLVPTTSPPLMRSPFPRVFVRLRENVAPAQVRDACVEATRAGLHVPGSPLNILLFGKRLHDEPEILAACENVRSDRSREVPAKTYIVVIDSSDWRALFASDAPPALRRFIDRLRG